MQIHPYLIFNGDCADAMAFYQQALQGELQVHHYSDMPEMCSDFKPEDGKRIMHARLHWGDFSLMASDSHPNYPSEAISGFSVAVMFPKPDEGLRVFNALSQGGNITMPWAATPWAEGFGMFKDKYGVSWMVNGGPIAVPVKA